MKEQSLKKIWILRILLLLIPTMFLGYYLFMQAVAFWDINNPAFVFTQYICWALGLVLAFILLSINIRPIIAVIINVLLIIIVNKIAAQYSQSEFFDFYLTYRLIFYAIGFIIGWFLVGRSLWQYLLGFIVFTSSLLLFSRIFHDDYVKLTLSLGLVLVSIGYLLFISAQLRKFSISGRLPIGKFVWSIGAFILIFCGLTFGFLQFFKKDIQSTINLIGGVDSFKSDAMTHTNADGSLSVNKSTSLTSNQKRGKALVFVAYIDNFFPSDSFANPLYLTEYYYTKYDTKTQTFEIDSNRNLHDWFHPNPIKYPLYQPIIDSSVMEQAKNIAYKKVVDVKIYKVNMAPDEYVAPSTSFYLENMSVAGDNLKQFRSGYMAKSVVSDLNSAYLIYNTDRSEIKAMQNQRYEILKLKNEKSNLSLDDYNYYTQVPEGADFDKIKNLALQITKGKLSDLDKMLAIKDYFNSKDPQGRPIFTYSDNPGEPDIPSANKLSYFLFQNKKGYCAYYAGATLFMLRALGVPSRIAAGYMTVDRSSKNKGWYWYYQDQAHAWVQIYFPGYGWLDFDTTVGNDAEDSPAPDGTPPDPPQDPSLSINGIITNMNTVKHVVEIDALNYNILNVNHQERISSVEVEPNSTILIGDSIIKFAQIHIGDTAQALSFNNQLVSGLDIHEAKIIDKIAKPIKVDELHIKPKINPEKNSIIPQNKDNEKSIAKWVILLASLIMLGLFTFISRYWLIFYYNRFKIKQLKSSQQKGFYAFKNINLLLGRQNLPIEHGETLMDFAQRINNTIGVNIDEFVKTYDSLRFSNLSDSTEYANNIARLYFLEEQKIYQHFGKKTIIKAMFYKIHK